MTKLYFNLETQYRTGLDLTYIGQPLLDTHICGGHGTDLVTYSVSKSVVQREDTYTVAGTCTTPYIRL